MSKIAVIIGSSRSDGNTLRSAQLLQEGEASVEVFNLSDYEIGLYDYYNQNSGDDFIKIIEQLIDFIQIVFVTPVYWYSMSAQMKTFFDRLSDLITIRKDLGRGLRGKSTFLLANGTGGSLPPGFIVPFEDTSHYFDMKFEGACYLHFMGASFTYKSLAELADFKNKVFVSSQLRVK